MRRALRGAELACGARRRSPGRCSRRRRSAAARTASRTPPRRVPPCFSRLSRARALNWSRFQPALATPMTGTFEVAALDHRLQRREDLLVGQIAGGAEEDQRVGVAVRSSAVSALRYFAGRLLDVSAELEAHRRQQLVLEVRLAARAEALVERGGQHRRRHGFVDRGLDRPAAFAGVGDAAGELRAVRDLRAAPTRSGRAATRRSRCRAATPRRCRARFEVVLVVLGIAQRRRLGVDRRACCLPTLAARRMPRPSA